MIWFLSGSLQALIDINNEPGYALMSTAPMTECVLLL